MDIQKSLVYFREATAANSLHSVKHLIKNKAIQENHALRAHLHDVIIETEQARDDRPHPVESRRTNESNIFCYYIE